MEFSTDFVTLRDRLKAGYDPAFRSEENAPVAGRTAALLSTFGLTAERKVLGVMPTGGTSHAHEYRLLFAAPTLDEAALRAWWDYAVAAEQALVRPDETHEFSILSLVLATERLDRPLQKQLKRLSAGRHFQKPLQGWSSVRLAVIDLSARRVYVNRMGEPLKNVLSPLL